MCGVISLGNLKSKILKGKVFGTDTVAKAVYTTYKKVTLDTTLIKLNRILDKEHFALVVHQQRLCKETTTPPNEGLALAAEPSTRASALLSLFSSPNPLRRTLGVSLRSLTSLFCTFSLTFLHVCVAKVASLNTV